MDSISLYLHIPFCQHRCGYCDFNTYAGIENLIDDYVNALIAEINFLGLTSPDLLDVKTIFFGGGTPSLLTALHLSAIITSLKENFRISPEVEFSLEANPGTISKQYLKDIFQLGINRLSLGMQSAKPEELRVLERQHSFFDVISAVEWARKAGFENINLDLIFGIPNQSLESWQDSLNYALSLQPEHLALYALAIEHRTPLQHQIDKGLLVPPNPDLAASMYETAMAILTDHGFTQYEISNWAKKRPSSNTSTMSRTYACEHNLQYWRNLPYIGFGAGAHGYISNFRTVNVYSPQAYIKRCTTNDTIQQNRRLQLNFPQTPGTQSLIKITKDSEIAETMMMGLRLVQEGISDATFRNRFDISLEEKFNHQIDKLIKLGLLEWNQTRGKSLRLTKRGRLLGNQVFMEFI